MLKLEREDFYALTMRATSKILDFRYQEMHIGSFVPDGNFNTVGIGSGNV